MVTSALSVLRPVRPTDLTPDRCVRRVLLRIAGDMDELARTRIVEELEQAQVDRDVRAERRRRLAESPPAFPAHAAASASIAKRCMTSRRSRGGAARPNPPVRPPTSIRRRNGK